MKSVGDILRKQREHKKLTYEDLHKFIKIHPRYLKALEESDYAIFADKVHAKGFLKIYAEFLELNVDEVLAFWRREYEGEFEKKSEKARLKNFSALESSSFRLTPSTLFGALLFLMVVGFFSYLFYQYRTYAGSPNLEVVAPADNLVVDNDILDIAGKTERDSTLLLNSQKVVLNTDGSFATSIKLNQGLNTLSFVAVNKLGKETEVVKTIIYRPPTPKISMPEVAGIEDTNEASESTGSVLSE